jgi:hypothetical protein
MQRLLAKKPDLTLKDLRAATGLSCTLPDIRRARRIWRRQQAGLDPSRPVFLDESGAKTNLPRRCGRARRGERVHASAPCGHWQTTTMISSIRLEGSTTCMAIQGATDTEGFRAYVRKLLCPTLRPGDLVAMDDLSPHKHDPSLRLIEQAGAAMEEMAARTGRRGFPERRSRRKWRPSGLRLHWRSRQVRRLRRSEGGHPFPQKPHRRDRWSRWPGWPSRTSR